MKTIGKNQFYLILLASFFIKKASTTYQGCEVDSTCFGSDPGCLSSGNCPIMASFHFDAPNKLINFMIQGASMTDGNYIAVGISTDNSMGSDLVFHCPNVAQGFPKVSYNVKKSNINDVTGVSLTNSAQSVINGNLTCTFTVNAQVTPVVSGQAVSKIDLIGTNYYLLLARGPVSGTNMQEHDQEISSPNALNFTIVVSNIEGAEDHAAFKVHGCLMCLAWLASAPTGMLLARYFRKTWTSLKPCGKDFWFRSHQVCMSVTVVFTLVSLIVILAVEGLTPFEELKENPHPAIGLVCIIATIIQPIMAFFRPHPGTSNRSIFNWSHRIVGNIGLIFGITAIFLGIDYDAMNLPESLFIALIVWIIVYLAVQVALSFLMCSTSKSSNGIGSKQEEEDGQEMEYPNNGFQSPVPDNQDENGVALRKSIGILFFCFVWIFAVAFIVVIIAV